MFDEYTNRLWSSEDISSLQTDRATALRIPFLTSASPRWPYIIGIVVEAGEPFFRKPQLPTDEEVDMIAEHLKEYIARFEYVGGFLKVMKLFAPFDIDGGANLGYFMKREDGGWALHKRTWEFASEWYPRMNMPPMTLQDLLVWSTGN